MRLLFPASGILTALALQVQAISFVSTNSYHTASNTVVQSEQWISADQITLDAEHQNDLFLVGGHSVELNGRYEGSLWGAAGQSIHLGGSCERSIRLAGRSVRIDGTVGGNVMALADTVIFGTNSVVRGSVLVLANTVIHEGTVQGDAAFYASRTMTLGGTVEGNAKAVAPEILLTRNARFQGDLAYTSPRELVPDEGVVAGRLKRVVSERPPVFTMARLASVAMWFFAALLVGIPFITLFPMSSAMATQLVRRSPWKCLLVGFVAFWGLIIISITCISAVVGLPLGLLLFAAWGALAYLGHIIIALTLGTLLLKPRSQSAAKIILSMAAGLAIIYLPAIIPGPLYLFQQIIAWFGMGALILAMMEKRRLIIEVPHQLKQAEALQNETSQHTEDSP